MCLISSINRNVARATQTLTENNISVKRLVPASASIRKLTKCWLDEFERHLDSFPQNCIKSSKITRICEILWGT